MDLAGNPLRRFGIGSSYLTIYFSLVMIPTVIITLKYSNNYKGAWIYKAAPLAGSSGLFSVAR